MSEKKLANLNYGIVGLGIMGGSFAKAIRKNILEKDVSTLSQHGCGKKENVSTVARYDSETKSQIASGKIFALDLDANVLQKAKRTRVIDEGFLEKNVKEMLGACDVVFVCLYPKAALRFFETHTNDFKQGSIVTDISGVKGFLQKALQKNARNFSFDFILGHPMAGGAKEGFDCARSEYFQNRNYILMKQTWNSDKNISLFKKIIFALGFTRIVETDCKTHDKKIAFTSQLCHVIASALVKSTNDKNITEFGGGSFEDLTRIAMINAPLWSELFLENKVALLSHISAFQKEIAKMKTFVASSDERALTKYLRDVRVRRIEMEL